MRAEVCRRAFVIRGDREPGAQGLEDGLQACDREVSAAGEHAAQVAGVDAGFLAEAVAGAEAFVDEIQEVVAVVGWRDGSLGNTEARLEVVADTPGDRRGWKSTPREVTGAR